MEREVSGRGGELRGPVSSVIAPVIGMGVREVAFEARVTLVTSGGVRGTIGLNICR